MEQASLQPPLVSLHEQPEQAKPVPHKAPGFLRKHLGEAGMRLSLAWVCLAATLGSTALVQDKEQEPVQTDEPPVVHTIQGPPAPPAYSPINKIHAVKGGNAKVKAAATYEVNGFNYSIAVEPPDATTQDAYTSFFNNSSIHVEHPPALREVIHIRDKHTFSDIHAEHPSAYPFDIYNATNQPIDLAFMEYALRATKLWRNETNHQKYPDIDIEGHTLADINPISDPHVMIMVNHVPVGARSSKFANTIAVTEWHPDEFTRSFVKHTGPSSEPFMREAIATEICQSMVDVADEQLVPGMARQQRFMRQFAGSFNKPALHNLDLASQESVCNGLGNFVTAAYEGGHGLDQATRTRIVIPRSWSTPAVSMKMRWIDYNLYRSERSQFEELAWHVTQQKHNEIITGQGANTPTLDYYRDRRKR
jgi:hypothetical protein